MEVYQRKIQEYQASISLLKRQLQRLFTLRLLLFTGAAALIFLLANERRVELLFLVVPLSILVFGLALNRYNRATDQLRRLSDLLRINEQETSRLDNKLAGLPTGEEFLEREHPYLADVDAFGPHSLFQLLNRTTTESGRTQLAHWLAEPAPKAEILERQRAVRELAPKVDWRQEFQAAGMPFSNSKSSFNRLLDWMETPAQLLPAKRNYLLLGLVLAGLATAAAAVFIRHLVDVLYLNGAFSIGYLLPLLAALVLNSLLLRRLKPIAEEMVERLHRNVTVLGGYQALIARIESESFGSEALRRLQVVFQRDDRDGRRDGYSAVREIRRLKRILTFFQQRGTRKALGGNDFYTLFNRFFLLDIYSILLTEAWKARNRSNLRDWARAVGEFEAFSSLGGFAASNPAFAFPTVSDEPYRIDFRGLGHPLIHPSRRVCNDFALAERGAIVLITGSNMAGKSTFLRTVGVNLVLALMGAPCCLRAGEVSPMQLFTSMRTVDNLEEGVSSFYAELKRIRQLLTLLESGQAVFFLLDEMFKGTNSQDRYKGGVSLIKQLHELNAFGLISTHDLELARVAGAHLAVTNYSFNSELKAGEIVFNYTLTPGLCREFNASELMKRSGIRILSDLEPLPAPPSL